MKPFSEDVQQGYRRGYYAAAAFSDSKCKSPPPSPLPHTHTHTPPPPSLPAPPPPPFGLTVQERNGSIAAAAGRWGVRCTGLLK